VRPEAVGVDPAPELVEQGLPDHFGDVRCLDLDARAVQLPCDRLGEALLLLGIADEVEFAHAPEHVGAATLGLLAARHRVVARRCLRNTGERGGLGHRHPGERLVEVGLGGGGDAVGALAEEHGVEVELEDLLLRELPL